MMLSMGFSDDVEIILGAVPEQRQTLLFSATMPGWVRCLLLTLQSGGVLGVSMRMDLGVSAGLRVLPVLVLQDVLLLRRPAGLNLRCMLHQQEHVQSWLCALHAAALQRDPHGVHAVCGSCSVP